MFRLVIFFVISFQAMVFAANIPNPMEIKAAAEYHARGYEFQMTGDMRQAQFYYERAEPLAPDDAGLLNDMGLVYEAQGQVDLALEHYLKAVAADFRCLSAYSNLGYLYESRGNLELAARYFEDRVKYGDAYDPRTLQAQDDLDRVSRSSPSLQKKKLITEAMALANAMALQKREIVPADNRAGSINAEMEYQRGMRFFDQQRYEAARTAFEASLGYDLGHKAARHMLQRLKTRVQAVEKPLSVEDQAAAIAAMEYDKGLRLARDGYREEALKAFDRALVFTPSDPDIRAARAKVVGD